MWILVDEVDKAELLNCRQQVQPFCHDLFGVPEDILERGYYNGTLFRFPLRNTSHDRGHPWIPCCPEKIRTQLFETLGAEADSVLLFLNHVERVELYVKSEADCHARLVRRISIGSRSLPVVQQRRKEFQEGWNSGRSTVLCFPVTIQVSRCVADTDAIQTEEHSWVVSLCRIGNDEQRNVEEIISSLKVLPTGGVALPLYVSSESGDLKLPLNDQPNGQVFSFLRLPLADQNPTGWHAHVHAYFVLDHSRRNLKWPSATHDLSGVTDAAHRWNIFLKRVLLPQAMVALAEFITTAQGIVDDEKSQTLTSLTFTNYRAYFLSVLMPNPSHVSSQWKVLEELFYQKISDKEVFFHSCEQHEHNWVKAFDDKVVFDNTCHDESEVAIRRKILHFRGRLLVVQPCEILQAIARYNRRAVVTISPSIVCDCLKTGHAQQALSDAEKRKALRYVMNATASELTGVPLLPLNNGEWTSFGTGRKVYLPPVNSSEVAILMSFSELQEHFIRCDLEPEVLLSLQKIQRRSRLFKILSVNHQSYLFAIVQINGSNV